MLSTAAAHVRHALDGHPLLLQADATGEVEIDPRVGSMALAHLLENAAPYSPADREISIRATADADGLHVTASDRRPGLDPAELDHVFERF
jgi:signal transduction histidine kinase